MIISVLYCMFNFFHGFLHPKSEFSSRERDLPEHGVRPRRQAALQVHRRRRPGIGEC